jgi:glucosyl-3-phosphoglycerate synthase
MDPLVFEWFTANTWQNPRWEQADLVQAKGTRTISVVLPALNEEATVAGVIKIAKPFLGSLIDELVVVDSGSTDRTAEVALAAGARVVRREEVVTDLDPVPGKGEVLWRSLAATSGDLLVFIDSDLVDPEPGLVPGLLGPLLLQPEVCLVKAFYRRPLRTGQVEHDSGGGRVTELFARPVLAALWPELSGVVQPLGGEYAASREFLEAVPFAVGYGVEIGLLLSAYEMHGLAGIAQVNLGVRKHRNRALAELGVMARQILGTILARRGVADRSGSLTQFTQVAGAWVPDTKEVLVMDRPPMRTLISR